jgi:hypothetical protein
MREAITNLGPTDSPPAPASVNQRGRIKVAAVVLGNVAVVSWLLPKFIADWRTRVTTIELVGLVLLPTVLLYARSSWRARQWWWCVPAAVLLGWWCTYGLLHELSHLFGSVLLGRNIEAFHLPGFWRGDMTGWVRTEFTHDWQGTLMGLCPYLKDLVLAIAGFVVLKRRNIRNAFLVGLIFVFCCLSPLFDIVDNYVNAYLLFHASGTDFVGTELHLGAVWTNLLGVVFTGCFVGSTLLVMRRYRAFPDPQTGPNHPAETSSERNCIARTPKPGKDL